MIQKKRILGRKGLIVTIKITMVDSIVILLVLRKLTRKKNVATTMRGLDGENKNRLIYTHTL